ncbi:TPA: hypothetical protein N0F65_012733 [Lagenidium giganteum]|uniref:RRM domain-containing protein n=1 Tax=Lagenidium giganteum TaxID=4803 RepID=A0AAV2YGK3_9STRA|nr:TPA: hypothetical protein N0F65_012733 [Lagenidium giganteum]
MAPPSVEHMHTLKVDNVPLELGIDELKGLFEKFGEIGDVYIPRARNTTASRGFAFVRFMQKQDAEDALAGMDNFEFEGRNLRVQFARQKRPDNPKEFYSRQPGGYSNQDDDDRDNNRRYDDRREPSNRYDRYDRHDRYDRYDRSERRRSRSRSPADRYDGYDNRKESSRSDDRRRSRSRSRSRGRRGSNASSGSGSGRSRPSTHRSSRSRSPARRY